jgi:DUF1365 family protein
VESAIYKGKVFHARHVPKKHNFFYNIFLFWLDLDELDVINTKVKGFSTGSWAPVRFKRSDYLGQESEPLKDSVVSRMSELANQPLTGKVFLLGQVRIFGMYFSPVNFYYLRNNHGQFTHMLAEVSNTPWNQRHHYLVDLALQEDCKKAFHVSPFNPMDMVYKWKIQQPDQKLALSLSCNMETRHFDASLQLNKLKLNSRSLFNVMLSIPSMTIKTVFGIYWQAHKLFIKGNPIYTNK